MGHAANRMPREGVIFQSMSSGENILLEHLVYSLHEEKEPIGLSSEWGEFVLDVKISCPFFGIHNDGPGGDIF